MSAKHTPTLGQLQYELDEFHSPERWRIYREVLQRNPYGMISEVIGFVESADRAEWLCGTINAYDKLKADNAALIDFINSDASGSPLWVLLMSAREQLMNLRFHGPLTDRLLIAAERAEGLTAQAESEQRP